jgi:hypothetical protein
MTIVARSLLAFTLILVGVTLVEAAEETLTGKLVCAKCTLKRADAKECQDVLQVTDPKQAVPVEYYIVKNDVFFKAGESCMAEVPATVTGTVSQKDGRRWLTATKIDKKPAPGTPAKHPHH